MLSIVYAVAGGSGEGPGSGVGSGVGAGSGVGVGSGRFEHAVRPQTKKTVIKIIRILFNVLCIRGFLLIRTEL